LQNEIKLTNVSLSQKIGLKEKNIFLVNINYTEMKLLNLFVLVNEITTKTFSKKKYKA